MDSMDQQDLASTVQRIENEIKVLPAMQEDIRRLDGSLRRVVLEMVDVKEDLNFVKKKVVKLDSIEEKIEKLTEAMDRFSGKAQSYDAAKTLHGQSLTEAQVKLNDHERRIKGLEDRLQ